MADLLVLVCIIYSGTSVIQILVLVHVYKIQWKPQYRLYGTGTSLYNNNTQWNIIYNNIIDPMNNYRTDIGL